MNNIDDIHKRFKDHLKDVFAKNKKIKRYEITAEFTKALDIPPLDSFFQIVEGVIPFTYDNAVKGYIKDTAVHELKQTVTQLNFILLSVSEIISDENVKFTYTMNDLNADINSVLAQSTVTDIDKRTGMSSNKVKRKMLKIINLIIEQVKGCMSESDEDDDVFIRNTVAKIINDNEHTRITLDNIISVFEKSKAK